MGEAMDTTKKRSWCLPCINEGAGTKGSKRFQNFVRMNKEEAKKKYMCVYCHMSKKSRVGRSGLLLFFLLSAKLEIVVPGSRIQFRYFIFEISGKPSFIEAVLSQIMQIFYLLCSQFRQKASRWMNKTLLLVKQQKWLSEFCVKIHRVATKN